MQADWGRYGPGRQSANAASRRAEWRGEKHASGTSRRFDAGKGQCAVNGRPLEQWHAPQLARHRLSQQQTPPFAMPVWHYLALHQHHHPNDSVVEEITHKLGLADKLGRTVNHLSGGEWQRVRLAAVIAQIHPAANADGQLLLLDEPMNSLDVAQQAALDGMLSELVAAGITVVMSSHDLNHSLRRASGVAITPG
jgi:vitamin B12 transport system ATP-binding protein